MEKYILKSEEKTEQNLAPLIWGYILIFVIIIFINALGGEQPGLGQFSANFEVASFFGYVVKTILISGYIIELIRFDQSLNFEPMNIFSNLKGKFFQIILIILLSSLVERFLSYVLNIFLIGLLNTFGVSGLGLLGALTMIPSMIASFFITYVILIYTLKLSNNPNQTIFVRFGQTLKETVYNLVNFLKIDLHYYGLAYLIFFGSTFITIVFVSNQRSLMVLILFGAMLYLLFVTVRYFPTSTLAKMYAYQGEKRNDYD